MRQLFRNRAVRAAAVFLAAVIVFLPAGQADAAVVGRGARSTAAGAQTSGGTAAAGTGQSSGNTSLSSGTAAGNQSGAVAGAPESSAAEGSAAAVTGSAASGAAENTESLGAVVEATAPAGAAAGSNTLSEPRVVTTTLFGGGELMMLSPDSASQMEAFLITTKSGKVIVVDGGTENETEHLKQAILKRGGRVSAWLVTHPHSDHVGAMTKILNDENSGITVDAVYYHYLPIEWYQANEAYRADMVSQNLAALSKLSPSVNHPNIQKGDVIDVDDVRITVMNSPYEFQVNAINNSSVAYRVELNGKRILFLGDMGVPAGNSLLNEYKDSLGELKADIVQMAHHGEQGVDRNVYEAVRPQITLWCCPEWLWDNDSGSGANSGPWKTLEVRGWMRQLGVKTYVIAKDGDQVLR